VGRGRVSLLTDFDVGHSNLQGQLSGLAFTKAEPAPLATVELDPSLAAALRSGTARGG
jgi:hypothetical protein